MISSCNEWDTLKRVVVGDATYANWPIHDPVFSAEAKHTLWKETPLPQGPVPQHIIDEANEDLQILSDTLTGLGVDVLRPTPMNFQTHDGLYNYCPRDRLIVHGNTIINPAMMYPCRDMELQCYHDIVDSATDYHFMPRNEGMVLDAANVLRLGPDKMLFLESASGNRAAYNWLCKELPKVNIELCNFYAGVHIDSTIVALREGLVMFNASRVKPKTVPKVFEHWKKIWVDDVVAQSFYQYPYASKWIAMNMLVVDPHTVICDKYQTALIKTLERHNFTVVPLELRHSRTLGGGFHCVTLDLERG
jgi:glycine amidinotransferase/scyllo-inosamine-4-phosphate amidinotransferase 1